MMIAADNDTHGRAFAKSSFVPAGGRSIITSAEVLATGVQPTRKALPPLVPYGLSPHLYLQAALATRHPLSHPPESFGPVEYGLKHAPEDMEVTRARRLMVCKLLRELAEACRAENDELLEMTGADVKTVLTAFGVKNVALMREVLMPAVRATSRHLRYYSSAYQ